MSGPRHGAGKDTDRKRPREQPEIHRTPLLLRRPLRRSRLHNDRPVLRRRRFHQHIAPARRRLPVLERDDVVSRPVELERLPRLRHPAALRWRGAKRLGRNDERAPVFPLPAGTPLVRLELTPQGRVVGAQVLVLLPQVVVLGLHLGHFPAQRVLDRLQPLLPLVGRGGLKTHRPLPRLPLGGLLLLGFGRCGRRGGKGKGDNQDVSERFHGNLREVAVATAASIPSATGPAVPSQTRYAPAACGVRIHSTIALTTRSRAGSNAIPSSFSPDARACPPPPR